MAEVFFDNPPIPRGQEQEQLEQLFGYLEDLSGKLNTALMDITIKQLAPVEQEAVRSASAEEHAKRLETTKQLIIKSANIVRTEMDEIRTVLRLQIEANSEQFGALMDELENQIQVNANGISQTFTRISTITDATGALKEIQDRYKKYINIGVIGQKAGKDIIGIAIGEDITNEDGSLNLKNKMATFTKDKLSFYQGDYEVAYFASNTFNIASGNVTDSMRMGNHIWKVLDGGALALVAGSGSGGGQ